jgi:hypothetical protein
LVKITDSAETENKVSLEAPMPVGDLKRDFANKQNFKLTALHHPDIKKAGVYALADATRRVFYVGQCIESTQGMGGRIQRHLTCGRSDPMAKQKIDPAEIAYAMIYPSPGSNKDELSRIEEQVTRQYMDDGHPIMAAYRPKPAKRVVEIPTCNVIQLLPDDDIADQSKLDNYLLHQQEMLLRVTRYYLDTDASAAMNDAIRYRQTLVNDLLDQLPKERKHKQGKSLS